ncbi:YkoF family thiamine/hydroxymethylpyrimidine-binding protein [Halalkalibaculum sp. DA3122]|uniref:YkoF family thiamine/hydroxymethylpyrimidine-binding protein n=1 Tax=Halalkalibaculum sp. DA3122 TaxID=3373607 RepID=UPI0037544E6F
MITTAQFTYIPLESQNPRESIEFLLEMVAQHEVEVDVNYLSTSVRGETDTIFELIREIYDTMTIEGEEFRFHIELLNPVPVDDTEQLNIPE